MLTAFKKFINDTYLFSPPQKILLAVSGGVDSVVMAHLFHLSQFDFAIAHCNFSLRAKESDLDEIFVQDLAFKYKVPFFTIRFDTKNEASKRKISTQMAARDLRYEWFNSILKRENYDFVATAHHANDVLETVLLNITRGTGVAGLHGISPKNGKTIRPILFATKESIVSYAKMNQLKWRDDASNEIDEYARNFIRLNVVPLLKEINPNLENTTLHTVARLKQVEDAFLDAFELHKKDFEVIAKDHFKVSIKKMLGLPKAYLTHYLEAFGFSFNQIQLVFNIISSDFQPGKRFISPNYILVIDRDFLVITIAHFKTDAEILINENDEEVNFDQLKLQLSTVVDLQIEDLKNPTIGFFDLDKLKFPLRIRNWTEGDSFIPYGMKGNKKVSDFLVDSKVPLNLKSNVRVLLSGDDIIWVIGMRTGEKFKVSNTTKKILRIRMID